MQTEEMIPVNEFCSHHNIETSFIYSLRESGLIEISTIHEETFVPVNQLSQLEKLVRLYSVVAWPLFHVFMAAL